MADTRRAFFAKLDEVRPGMARAFLEAVSDLTSAAQIAALEDAINAGDIPRAYTVLSLDASFYAPLDRAMENAFLQGALYQQESFPDRPFGPGGGRLIIRFQGRHPEAERWVRERSSGLISEIVADQREAVRETIEAGLAAGRNPRQTALDIVGRTSGRGQVRTGGIVGLHSTQAAYVRSARQELEDLDPHYFTRRARDKRFDGTVRRAINSGAALDRSAVERIAGRYSARLLKERGDRIARTETIAALNAGRLEQARQLVERGDVPAEAIRMEWDATGDARTRPEHLALEGQTVRIGQPFVGPNGSLLRHPGDGSLGAPASMTVNCRCYMAVRIDWLSLAV